MDVKVVDAQLCDVIVCDICGDVGYQHLLAICSRCKDGAEHTYCMQNIIDQVPKHDWLCEECIFSVVMHTEIPKLPLPLEQEDIIHSNDKVMNEQHKWWITYGQWMIVDTNSLLLGEYKKLDEDLYTPII